MSRKLLLLPVSLALYVSLSACGSGESSDLFNQPVDNIVQQMNTGEWTTEVFRANSTEAIEALLSGEDTTPRVTTDFLVLTHKTPGETPKTDTFVLRLDCGDVNSEAALEMRTALGQMQTPPEFKTTGEDEARWVELTQSYTTFRRTFSCKTTAGQTTSFKRAYDVVTKDIPGVQRVYLEPASTAFNEFLVLDPSCENGVLENLGFGNRTTKLGKWRDMSDTAEGLNEFENRIALKCVKGQEVSTFKELCQNYTVGGYDQLYFIFKDQYVGQSNECNNYSAKVNAGLKSSHALKLSYEDTKGRPVDLKKILKLSVLKPKDANSSEVSLDDINSIDLQGQKIPQSDLVALMEALKGRATPLTLNIRGVLDEKGQLFADFSFLQAIANNTNITLNMLETDVREGAANCPVNATNQQIANICLRTVPFYDYCLRTKANVPSVETDTVKAYLAQYQAESKLPGTDTAADCKVLAQDLVKRKSIVLEDTGIASLVPFKNLPNLEALIVPGNKLTTAAVSALSGTVNLGELNVARNQLTQIPQNASWMNSLASLNVSQNQLTTLEGVGNLKALSVLSANNNALTVATSIESLQDTLGYLDLSSNKIFVSNQEVNNFKLLGALKNLQFLDISSTGLAMNSTNLVDSTRLGGKFTGLLYLNVSDNALTGDVSEMKNVNASPIQNPLAAIVGLGTGLKGLQALDIAENTLKLGYFSAQTPGAADSVAAKLNTTKAFYQYLYAEAAEDPFKGIDMTGEASFTTPELVFDKASIDCSVIPKTKSAQKLCGQ